MSAISFILVSAVFMIIANPPVTADLGGAGRVLVRLWPLARFFATANKLTLLIPFNMTMGILSVIVTFAIAYNLAGTYKMPKLNAGMTSLVMFLIAAAPSSYYQLADESVPRRSPAPIWVRRACLPPSSLPWVSVEVTRFQTKGITIKMPDGVPPFLSETFGAIVPMLANILIFFGGNLLIQMIDPTLSIPSVIEKLLAAPLSVAVDSVPGALLICFMTLLFWCFGVHGNMIVMPITAPVTLLPPLLPTPRSTLLGSRLSSTRRYSCRWSSTSSAARAIRSLLWRSARLGGKVAAAQGIWQGIDRAELLPYLRARDLWRTHHLQPDPHDSVCAGRYDFGPAVLGCNLTGSCL